MRKRGEAHELDTPTEDSSLPVLLLCQLRTLDDLYGIDDGNSTVEFAWESEREQS